MTTPTEAERDAEVLEALNFVDDALLGNPGGYSFEAMRTLAAECRRLQSELERVRVDAGMLKLARFGAACLTEARGGGEYLAGELDGGWVQDTAEAAGLLVPVKVEQACGENCVCAEWDDFPQDCYRVPPDVRAAIDEARKGGVT